MKRVLLAITVGLSVFGLVFGAAASLTVNADQMAAGESLAVSGCDDAVDVAFGLATGGISDVAKVTVSDIATACDGQELSVEVVGDTTQSGTATVTGTSHEITLSGTVDAASVSQVNVTITGPAATP